MAATVLNIGGDVFDKQYYLIPGGAKLTKDGRIKQTPNNASGDHFVFPIKEVEKIEQIKEYLWSKIDDPVTRPRDRKACGRNYLMFCIGINVGLRYSDLVNLTWDKIFRADMETFRSIDARNKKEQKTGKQKVMYINDSIKQSVTRYIERFDPELGSDIAIFDTGYRKVETYIVDNSMCYRYTFLDGRGEKYERTVESDRNGNPKKDKDGNDIIGWLETIYLNGIVKSKGYRKDCKYPVSDTTVGNFIKEAGKYVGIDYPICTHSLRKTYAYQLYIKNQDNPFVLSYIQKMLGHANQADTIRYLGLEREMEEQMVMELNL